MDVAPENDLCTCGHPRARHAADAPYPCEEITGSEAVCPCPEFAAVDPEAGSV